MRASLSAVFGAQRMEFGDNVILVRGSGLSEATGSSGEAGI